MYALTQLIKLQVAASVWAGRWVWKIVTAPFLLLYWFFKSLFLAAIATPRLVFITAPIKAYRKLIQFRNWLLEKVEYLQAESAKWKTTFAIVKSPFTLLTKMGFSPQMAASLLIGTSVVGGGVVVSETVFSEPSFANGDTGIYSAPSDVPTFWEPSYNTLRVDLGTTAVKTLVIKDVSVNSYTGSTIPSGATTTIDVGGNGAVDTWLHVGEFIFEKNRCETLLLNNISVHTLNITDNASDGQSISPSAGTIRNRAILGGHGMAADMSTAGGLYDRVWIQAPTTTVNGQIDKLTISNLYTKGGACVLSRIKGGTLTIRLNVIGGDSNLATKAFTIATDVTASVINNSGNVEVAMAVPATQTIDN